MATTIREPLVRPRGPVVEPRPTDFGENLTPAVKRWAALGAVTVVFIAYVLIRWVTGRYWHHVATGPTQPPTWMPVDLVLWQIVSIPAALGVIGCFVVRPLIRNRTIGVDGILVCATRCSGSRTRSPAA